MDVFTTCCRTAVSKLMRAEAEAPRRKSNRYSMLWQVWFKIPDWQVVTAAADAADMRLADYVYQSIVERALEDNERNGIVVETTKRLPDLD